MARPYRVVKPAFMDPNHSVDVFDGSRKNEFGEMYCIAPAILFEQIDEYWERYISTDFPATQIREMNGID